MSVSEKPTRIGSETAPGPARFAGARLVVLDAAA